MTTNMADWLVWKHDDVPGACALRGMTGFDDDWKLLHGVALNGKLPARTRLAMDPDLPNDVMLTDSLINADMLIVASERLRDLVAGEQPAAVEYLPVTVVNHKKRAIAEPYFVIHPIHPIDALDAAGCEGRVDPIAKDTFASIKRLVFDASAIPADRQLFRFKSFPDLILARRSLAEKIDAAGLSGIRWLEVADYGGG